MFICTIAKKSRTQIMNTKNRCNHRKPKYKIEFTKCTTIVVMTMMFLMIYADAFSLLPIITSLSSSLKTTTTPILLLNSQSTKHLYESVFSVSTTKRHKFVLNASTGGTGKSKQRSSNTASTSGGGFGRSTSTGTTSSSASNSSSSSSSSSLSVTSDVDNKKQQQLRSISGTSKLGIGNKQMREATTTYDKLRKLYGANCSHDIYIRSPNNDENLFWFVGKIAIDINQTVTTINNNDNDNPTTINDTNTVVLSHNNRMINDACIGQKRLIIEYSKIHLRPQNFGIPKYANALEIWYVLQHGDNEMNVVQNKVQQLYKVIGNANTISSTFNINTVGYTPEIYVGEELVDGGLRVKRTIDGKPIHKQFDVYEGA